MKNLKTRLRQGDTLHGCWLNLGSPLTAEIVGLSGFDWVLIDLEHGAGTEKDVLHQLQALEHTPAAAVVRIESGQRQRIHRILDLGAEGIMIPRISNAAEAAAVASGLRYPPDGSRGIAKMVRASGFGQHFPDYFKNGKDDILGVVQIETAEVLNHLDAVAALDGIDVLFIGPSDLSMELGIFGQLDHSLFKDAVKATVNAAQKAGKAAGILIPDPNDQKKYHEMGIRMIACGADGTFVGEGARNMAKKLKTLFP
ncbi:MAG TPA: aldolase/citrate lyase family protein [Puia sp.]|nr:aldolase/citrate lyase family protein [Puia sp.]